jgi:hypothetical protein
VRLLPSRSYYSQGCGSSSSSGSMPVEANSASRLVAFWQASRADRTSKNGSYAQAGIALRHPSRTLNDIAHSRACSVVPIAGFIAGPFQL